MEIINNIKRMRTELRINQEQIADALGFDIANYSRIENGKQDLKVKHLEIIAKLFKCEIIDLFTYPRKYVDKNEAPNAERISVTFEVSPDKRDVLLSLVTKNE